MTQTRAAPESVAAAYVEAVWDKAPERLAALFADDARVFDMWERWSFDDAASWRANLHAWLGGLGAEERVRVRFDDLRSDVRGDTALLTAIVTYAAIAPGGETLRALQNRLTWVLAAQGDGWLIAHEHTSAPIGPDGQPLLRRDGP